MKKALALFICLLMLTGCSQTDPTPAETDSVVSGLTESSPAEEVLPVEEALSAEEVLPAEAALLNARIAAPAAITAAKDVSLSNGTRLKMNGSGTFSSEEILAAAEAIPANAFDCYRQTAILYDEAQHGEWISAILEEHRHLDLSSGKMIALQSDVTPDSLIQISSLCSPAADFSIDAALEEQITRYFHAKLSAYNVDYEEISFPAMSDRVAAENQQWIQAFSDQQNCINARYVNVDSTPAIRSVTRFDEYLLVGVQEQLYIGYQYPESEAVNNMAYAIDHVLVLRETDTEYSVVRDFYISFSMDLDTSEGIDEFISASSQSLIWLMSYNEESGIWQPAAYLWLI